MIEKWKIYAKNLLDEDENKCHAFLSGVKVGVEMFAWWKDGTEHVGTGSYTKKEIYKEIDEWAKENKIDLG